MATTQTHHAVPLVKKTLFSLAFVAASGAYVAAVNHLLPIRDEAAPSLLTDTAAPVNLSPVAPAASTTQLVVSSQPPSHDPVPTIATIAPVTAPRPTVPAPVAPASVPVVPVPAPVTAPVRVATAQETMPPLPRPRPALPASVQQTASSNVSTTGYRDGAYTGSRENAYYGTVQVQVIITNHQVATVKVLSYPSDRRTSRYINSQALPMLQQEVIAADSAHVDTVSGATLTSEAYIRSLGTALQQAGGAGA